MQHAHAARNALAALASICSTPIAAAVAATVDDGAFPGAESDNLVVAARIILIRSTLLAQ
jgi:hypothetical protein